MRNTLTLISLSLFTCLTFADQLVRNVQVLTPDTALLHNVFINSVEAESYEGQLVRYAVLLPIEIEKTGNFVSAELTQVRDSKLLFKSKLRSCPTSYSPIFDTVSFWTNKNQKTEFSLDLVYKNESDKKRTIYRLKDVSSFVRLSSEEIEQRLKSVHFSKNKSLRVCNY